MKPAGSSQDRPEAAGKGAVPAFHVAASASGDFSGSSAPATELEAAVVAYFIEAAGLLGVPKSVAAIYGICFASPEPLSFSEIHERLDLSAGSISQGLKLLREIGALKVAEGRDLGKPETLKTVPSEERHQPKLTSIPAAARTAAGDTISTCQRVSVSAFRRGGGSAATRYAPDLELRRLAQHFLLKRVQPQLASGRDRLAGIVGGMDAGPVRARLEHLQNWHAKADGLLPLAAAFLGAAPSET